MGLNFNSDIKILITGARGFIGSRVAMHLLACGYDVYGLSRGGAEEDSPIKSWNDKRESSGHDNLKFIQGNFGDSDRMAGILSSVHPDVIIHCAGVTPHGDVNADDYYRVNVTGGRNLLESMSSSGLSRGSFQNQKDSPIKSGNDRGGESGNDGPGESTNDKIAFINASTIGVYGQPLSDDGMVREGDICDPLSPYAQSKYEFEQMLSDSDIPHVNLRIANIPGRDAFINYVLNNGRVQFNGDVPYVRDYIHAHDLAKLFEKSIHHLMNGGHSLIVNAGSGVGFSFPDIVDEIENQTGMVVERSTADAKTGDVVKILCDISTVNYELGWKPDHIDLKDIIDYALRNKTI